MRSLNTSQKATPFVKWVGGKRQLIEEIRKRMPLKFGSYFEPFLGGAALFFDLEVNNATINDISSELINCYIAIKNNHIQLMEYLDEHEEKHQENPKEYYYKIREMDRQPDYADLDKVKKAARLIYLNKTCFNGLYRVNSKGYFNVPFNGKLKINTYNKSNIECLHQILENKSINIISTDFEEAVSNAQSGDFIFFDPPYDLLKEDSFDSYNKDSFGVEGQIRLSKVAHELSNKGCFIMLTNHNTPLINQLYSDFNIDVVNVKRMINSDASNRVGMETIITNYVK
jgi:DNA adenine methylase